MSAKEDLFNYVIESPENTNPAVLKSLINSPDLKEVEIIELTFEEANTLLSNQSHQIQTFGGRSVKDIGKEIRNGKPMPILRFPYDKPSSYYIGSDCRFIGKDPSPDVQYETLVWTLVLSDADNAIKSTGKGFYCKLPGGNITPDITKIHYIYLKYNASVVTYNNK